MPKDITQSLSIYNSGRRAGTTAERERIRGAVEKQIKRSVVDMPGYYIALKWVVTLLKDGDGE